MLFYESSKACSAFLEAMKTFFKIILMDVLSFNDIKVIEKQ